MAETKSRLKKSSILLRIMLTCILPLICVFFIFAMIINRVVYNQITTNAMEKSTIFANEITEKINNNHTNIKALLEWVRSRLLVVDPSDPHAADEISSFIGSLLTATPYVHCIWFSFEPGGFAEDRLSMDYVKNDEGIALYFDLDVEILHDPEKAPWYYMPYTTGEIWFDAADYYSYQTGIGYKYTDTVSMPLIRDGSIVGVVGIDTLYEDQFRFVGAKDIENERLILLMTYEGEIVYSSDGRFLTEQIFDMPGGDSGVIAEALNSDAPSLFDGVSPFFGDRSVMSFRPVYVGFASKQLYLYIDMPTNALFKPADDAARMITLLSIASLLTLGIVLFLIIKNALAPIKKLTESANRIAEGELATASLSEFEATGSPVYSRNEITILSTALRKMLTQLRQAQALELREQAIAADNAALVRLSQLKNDLVATISHELRTPLTVMSNYAQLAVKAIQRGDYTDESLQRLSVVPKEAKRLADLSATLLEAFREQAGAWQKSSLSIGDLLTHTANVFKPITDKKSNRQTLQIAPDLPPVYGNADELMQVLFNLLSNADAHTKNGEITIAARAEKGPIVAVTIADTGEGIAPELMPHVFGKHVHGETGTGYGLAICKEIIEEHGGKISLSSVHGEGTTVSFVVPVWKGEKTNG